MRFEDCPTCPRWDTHDTLNAMSHYVIYARKSTESEDRQVLSIESQINELRRIATREGVTISEVLTEAKSAKAPGRPVFNTLFRRVDRGEIGGILCWKMDRLARNHLDTGLILQALADHKIERIITSDGVKTQSGNDRFMGTFELAVATKFIDDLRANTMRGQRARAEKGWASGIPPLGYLNDYATKTIVKDPDRFELVQRMWELLLTGTVSVSRIRKIAANEWGLRTRPFGGHSGKPLARSAVYRMFSNPFYVGIIKLRGSGTWVGAHPPMVTREEFDRAQEILGRPGRERPTKHSFDFAGVARCGNCGSVLTGEAHVKPSGLRLVYYRCAGRRSGRRCTEPAIPARDLEAQTRTQLHKLSVPDVIRTHLRGLMDRTLEGESTRRAAVLETLKATMTGLRKEEENLLSLRLRDMIDDQTFTARRQALQDHGQRMQDRLHRAESVATATTRSITALLDFAAKVDNVFASGTPVQRRAILEAVTSNLTVRARKAALEFKNPFRLIAESGGCHNWYSGIDHLRTWLDNTTDYFRLPDLDAEPIDAIALPPAAKP
jgi:site-specific DNA recombinase